MPRMPLMGTQAMPRTIGTCSFPRMRTCALCYARCPTLRLLSLSARCSCHGACAFLRMRCRRHPPDHHQAMMTGWRGATLTCCCICSSVRLIAPIGALAAPWRSCRHVPRGTMVLNAATRRGRTQLAAPCCYCNPCTPRRPKEPSPVLAVPQAPHVLEGRDCGLAPAGGLLQRQGAS